MSNDLVTIVRRLIGFGEVDLSDAISDLTPEEWCTFVAAAGMHRCTKCGEFDACECPDEYPSGIPKATP